VVALIRHDQHENIAGGEANHEFDEGNDEEVEAFARDVLVQRKEEEDVFGEAELLASEVFGNGAEHGTEGVAHDVDGTRDAVGLQHAFPAFCGAEDALHVAIENVDKGTGWGCVGKVDVGPETEGAVVDGFADVLDVAADDGEVTVYENDVGLFSVNDGRKLGEGEARAFLLVLVDCVDDFYSGRICAAEVGVDHLLGGEVYEGEPGVRGELLDDV